MSDSGVNDVEKNLKKLEDARANTRYFTEHGQIQSAKQWGGITNDLYRVVARDVRAYRRFCNKQPGETVYLQGVVAGWERRLKAVRK
jgi:hypothetical protein